MISRILTQEEIDAAWDAHIAAQKSLNGPEVCALVSAAAEASARFSEDDLEAGKEAQ